MENISLQLYSIKEAMAQDYMGTIAKVAQMGYTGVEFAGFAGFSAQEIKEQLEKTGLMVSGSHVPIVKFREDVDEVIRFHKEIGCKHVTIPYAQVESKEQAESLKQEFLGYAKKLAEHGMTFSYHNHAHEMVQFDGLYALDIMLGDESLKYEVDTFWTEYAKVDTDAYLKGIGERCPLVHLKDMNEEGESTIFGAGILDNKKIVSASLEYCKPEWLVIEWEGFGSCDCLYAVEESVKNLKELLATLE